MGKISEYPEAEVLNRDDVILIDGTSGTRIMKASDLALALYEMANGIDPSQVYTKTEIDSSLSNISTGISSIQESLIPSKRIKLDPALRLDDKVVIAKILVSTPQYTTASFVLDISMYNYTFRYAIQKGTSNSVNIVRLLSSPLNSVISEITVYTLTSGSASSSAYGIYFVATIGGAPPRNAIAILRLYNDQTSSSSSNVFVELGNLEKMTTIAPETDFVSLGSKTFGSAQAWESEI